MVRLADQSFIMNDNFDFMQYGVCEYDRRVDMTITTVSDTGRLAADRYNASDKISFSSYFVE